MKIQYVAEDGKVFESETEPMDDFGEAKWECEEYEQYVLGIDHGHKKYSEFWVTSPYYRIPT